MSLAITFSNQFDRQQNYVCRTSYMNCYGYCSLGVYIAYSIVRDANVPLDAFADYTLQHVLSACSLK